VDLNHLVSLTFFIEVKLTVAAETSVINHEIEFRGLSYFPGDTVQIFIHTEISWKNFSANSIPGIEVCRQSFQALSTPGNQNQVGTGLSQLAGIFLAQTRRSTGNQRLAKFIVYLFHPSLLSAAGSGQQISLIIFFFIFIDRSKG